MRTEDPRAPGCFSYLGKSPEHQSSGSRQLPSLWSRAEPALLLSLGLRSQTRAPCQTRPQTRSAPPPEAPPRTGGGGSTVAGAEPELLAARGAPVRPALGPNQEATEGCSGQSTKDNLDRHPSWLQKGGRSQNNSVAWTTVIQTFISRTDRGERGHSHLPLLD